MVLAVLIVPVMYLTSVWQVARANQPPFTDPLTWTIVPLAVIIPFAVMVWPGWKHRRNAQWHKRAMLSAAILMVAGPSIGRLPIAPPTIVGFTVIFLLGLLLFVPLFVWDKRTQGTGASGDMARLRDACREHRHSAGCVLDGSGLGVRRCRTAGSWRLAANPQAATAPISIANIRDVRHFYFLSAQLMRCR